MVHQTEEALKGLIVPAVSVFFCFVFLGFKLEGNAICCVLYLLYLSVQCLTTSQLLILKQCWDSPVDSSLGWVLVLVTKLMDLSKVDPTLFTLATFSSSILGDPKAIASQKGYTISSAGSGPWLGSPPSWTYCTSTGFFSMQMKIASRSFLH